MRVVIGKDVNVIHERIDVSVAARQETIYEVLKDVEAVGGWLQPHLPAWPKLQSEITVVERFDDGAPRTVRTVSTVLGISDDALGQYEWFPDGCRTTMIKSRTLRHHTSRFTIIPEAAGSRLVVDIHLDLKINLPGLVERQLKKTQIRFAQAFQRALAAESERRELTEHGRERLEN